MIKNAVRVIRKDYPALLSCLVPSRLQTRGAGASWLTTGLLNCCGRRNTALPPRDILKPDLFRSQPRLPPLAGHIDQSQAGPVPPPPRATGQSGTLNM